MDAPTPLRTAARSAIEIPDGDLAMNFISKSGLPEKKKAYRLKFRGSNMISLR
jgi:hypothetical protein